MIRRPATVVAVVIAVALPGVAIASGTKSFHGKTSQGLGMEFSLTPDGRAVENAAANYRCGGAHRQFGAGKMWGDNIPIKNGKFAFTSRSNGVKFLLQGKVGARSVTGSFSITRATCKTGKVTFTLH
jgi:hypothetical protein